MYAAERSTLVGSFPEKAPPPWCAYPPYVSTMIFRAEVRNHAGSADLGETPNQAVGELDRHRHQLGRLPAREAEHHPLVPRAACVDPEGDVGRLLVDGGQDRAGVAIEPELGARVP